MNTPRKTIFDLERRNDLATDFRWTVLDLNNTSVTTKSLGSLSLKKLLNDCIRTWPYRQGANSIASYASALGFDIYEAEDETDILYNYELFLNLLHWAPTYDINRADMFSFNESSTVNEECTRCIENIEYKLEMVNMRVRTDATKGIPRYVISKRDAQVDAVIEAEIGDFQRFSSPDKILAFAGLSPTTYQSGKYTSQNSVICAVPCS